jgi:nicotinate-nucleotide adenylyltransferase
LGGSFDPPHVGHLLAAEVVLEALELDRILLIPVATAPHKPEGARSPGALRLRMLREAVSEDPRLEPSDLELRRGGVSFTVETLRELVAREPGTEWFLLMGADQWRGFQSWREPEAILELATPVVLTREGEGVPDTAGERVLGVRVPRLDISSSEVRARVRDGRSIRHWVPDEVRRVIEAAKLYQEREP